MGHQAARYGEDRPSTHEPREQDAPRPQIEMKPPECACHVRHVLEHVPAEDEVDLVNKTWLQIGRAGDDTIVVLASR